MKKRILALSLSILMILSLLPLPAKAEQYSCGKEAHTHDDSCKIEGFACGKELTEGHEAHVDDCCRTLSCEEEHKHEEGCYTASETAVCGYHVHTDDCKGLVLNCGKTEHVHDDCTLTCSEAEGCGAEEHTTNCPEYIWPCDGSKTCKADTHEDGCLRPAQAAFEEKLSELPSAAEIVASEENNAKIGAAADFAVENGLYATKDEALNHPTLAALLNAMYNPKEAPEGDTKLPEDNTKSAAVAKIGDVTYESLQAAVDAAEDDAVITLLKDTTEEGTKFPGADPDETGVIIPTGKDITIDLGGFTFNGSLYGNGITLTVQNGTIDTVSGANAIEVEDTALTLESTLTIVSNHRSGVRAKGGTTTINGGSYKSVAGGTTHALYVSGGAVVTVNSGTFRTEGEETSGSALMISSDDCRVTINGGHFSSNTNTSDGTICITANSLILKGGTFVPNENAAYSDGLEGELASATYVDGYGFGLTNGTYGVAESKVAVTNGTTSKGYTTLDMAIRKATASDTIQLLSDITESNITVDVGKTVTIDLNQKTVNGYFMVYGTAAIKNGTINNTVDSVSAIENNGTASNLTVENVNITSDRHAIRVDGGNATITGGTHVGGHHGFNISSGATAVINVESVTGTANGSAVNVRDSGTEVTINGGKLLGGHDPNYGQLGVMGGTVIVNDAQCDVVASDVAMTIKGGTFGQVKKMTGRGIEGGTYTSDPSAYVISSKAASLGDDGKYTIVAAKAAIGDQGYASLADAAAKVKAGEEILLLADSTDDFTAEKNFVVNLDTNSLESTITISDGVQLTIKGTSDNNAITLTAPAKDGYTFGGWYTDAALTTVAAATITEVTETGTTFYPKWALTEPTVTISADKTSIVSGTGTAVLTATPFHTLSDATFTYQWYKGTEAISGATNTTYTVTGLTEAASYTCKVIATKDSVSSPEVQSEALTIKVAAAEGTISLSHQSILAIYGDETKKFTYTTNFTGSVSVTSSDNSVATVADNKGTVIITILKAGTAEITVSFAGSDTHTAVSQKVILNVAREGSKVVAPPVTVNYGQTISLTAEVQIDRTARTTDLGKATFYYGTTKLGEAPVQASAGDDTIGTATLIYDTKLGVIPAGENNAVTVEYSGSVNWEESNGILPVTLNKKAITITGLTAKNRTYNGTKTVTLEGGQLSGLETGDTVIATMPTSGTVETATVGEDKVVTYDVTLAGDKAGFYTLTKPAVTVDISKATLTAAYVSETITNKEEPDLKVTVRGFVNGETPASADGFKFPKVTISDSTVVGTYELTPTGGEATNYQFLYVKGTLTIQYAITKGAEQKFAKGDAALFKSNAPYSKFEKVKVDGKTIDPKHYDSASGSTVITLKASYTKTLSAGEHTLTIVSEDGSASTTFTVKSVISSGSSSNKYDKDNYATGDTTNTGLWLVLALVGAVGVVISLAAKKYLRKRK